MGARLFRYGALAMWLGGTAAVASCGGAYGSDPDGTSDAGALPDAGVLDGSALDGASTTDASDAGDGIDAKPPAFETLLTGINGGTQVGLSATHVYWSTSPDGKIRRCPLAGCAAAGIAPEIVANVNVPSGITVVGDTLFWASNYRQIMKCSLAGGVPCIEATFVDQGASSYPAHPTASGTNLYFVNESGATHRILTCPLTGCTAGYPKVLYASTTGDVLNGQSVSGLAVEKPYVYVTRFLGGIVRFQLTTPESIKAGSGTLLVSTPYESNDLDLDGTTLRWAVTANDVIATCTAPTCMAATPFLAGRSRPVALHSNAIHVYGLDEGVRGDGGAVVPSTGTLWRALK